MCESSKAISMIWTAWKNEEITEANAESQRATEEKNILTEQLAASQKAYADLNASTITYLKDI